MAELRLSAFSSLPEVARVSLSQQAADSIRDAILSGTLEPGTQLVEAELAEQMSISRAPIREAMRNLEEEGLVLRVPYRGVFVSHVSPADIQELYTLRSIIEVFAVRLAVERATDADFARLEAIVQAMQTAALTETLDQVSNLDMQFHRTLYEISGHKLLLQTWHGLEQKVRFIMALRHQGLYRRILQVVKTHQPLLEALRERNANLAVALIEEHILSSSRMYVEESDVLEDVPPADPASGIEN